MRADLILVGGGLANCLLAYRLRQTHPGLELLLVEREETLGKDHVWSFHGSDLTAAQHEWVGPLVERSWPAYEVRFPGLVRRLEGSYHSLTAARLDRVLRDGLGERARVGMPVTEVEPHRVRLGDGSTVEAGAVIDGRGAAASRALWIAFQKFVGLHVELAEPTALDGPILMDATVEQLDGFRFIYTLPFTDRSLLIEDTRYSDAPGLDRAGMRSEILRYARHQGWPIRAVVDQEEGVLPIALGGKIGDFWSEAVPGLPRSGMRAALFHPTTGYSLPEAVRLTDEVARLDTFSSAALERLVRRRSMELWRRGGFFRLLNRMLFQAADPDRRYRVLERFYRLPEPLIRRFYAGRPTVADRIRLLAGRPPVPLGRALRALLAGPSPAPEPTPEGAPEP